MDWVLYQCPSACVLPGHPEALPWEEVARSGDGEGDEGRTVRKPEAASHRPET